MAVLTINTNLSAMRAMRQLDRASSTQARVSERLSSGLRITRASDDAAGLSVSEKLRVDSRIYTAGIRNLNDGISLAHIGDSAVSELTNTLTRIEELAEQAATGTLGYKQRRALDSEAQQLMSEYNRIIDTTQFNGRNLFASDARQLSLSAGGDELLLTMGVTEKVGSGTFRFVQTGAGGNRGADLGDVNGDGLLDLVSNSYGGNTVSVSIGRGDGSFRSAFTYTVTNPNRSNFLDANGDGRLDIVTAGGGGLAVALGNGNGTFSAIQVSGSFVTYGVTIGDFNEDGLDDVLCAGVNNGPSALMYSQGDGTYRGSIAPLALNVGWTAAADFNSDGHQDILWTTGGGGAVRLALGNGNDTFKAPLSFSSVEGAAALAVGDINNDDALDFVSVASGANTAQVHLGNRDGTFREGAVITVQDVTYLDDPILHDMNGDGTLDLILSAYNSGVEQINLGNGDGTFGAYQNICGAFAPGGIAAGDLNRDGVDDLVFGSFGSSISYVSNTTTATTSLSMRRFRPGELSLLNIVSARAALSELPARRQFLQLAAGAIGAAESRTAAAISVLESARTGATEAASRITDADVAEETSMSLRTSILVQAGAAVLAQANQSPALALKLL